MHRRIGTRLLTITLAFGLVSIAAACTTTTAEPGTGSSKRTDGGTSSSGGSSEDDDDDGDDDPSTEKECSKETTALSCATCCGYNQQIEDILMEADEVYVTCACTAQCQAACGDFCTDPEQEPSTACITCLDSEPVMTECGPKADEICDKDDACVKFFECEEQAGCSAKDQPDAG